MPEPFDILTHAPEPDAHTLSVANTDSVLDLPLDGVQRVLLHFPAFTDGRAYSQAVMLRRRRGFRGDIRATGEVLVDQLSLMRRSGFSSAVLRNDQSLITAQAALAPFSDHYQGDAQQPLPRFARTRSPA